MIKEEKKQEIVKKLVEKANEIYNKDISRANYVQISNNIIEGIAKECNVNNEEAIKILEIYLNSL